MIRVRGKRNVLLAQSFFEGIFLSTLFTYAVSRFISAHDGLQLCLAFGLSGILGLGVTQLYRWFQHRLTVTWLYKCSLLLVSIFVALLLLLEGITTEIIQQGTIHFLFFIAISPIFTIVELQFWGIAYQTFQLRESKRVFGTISMGGVLAALLGYFLISFFRLDYEGFVALILLSALGMLIVQQLSINQLNQMDRKVVHLASGSLWQHLKAKKWLTPLFFIIFLAVLLQYVIDFNFLMYVKASAFDSIYGGNTSQVIAAVFVAVNAIKLVLKLSYSRLLRIFRKRRVLAVFPGLILLFICLYLIADLLFRSAFVSLASLFLMLRVAERSTRPSLETPTLSLFFVIEPASSRSLAQQVVLGDGKHLAMIVASVLLALSVWVDLSLIIFIGVLALAAGLMLAAQQVASRDYTRRILQYLNVKPEETLEPTVNTHPKSVTKVNHLQRDALMSAYQKTTLATEKKDIFQLMIETDATHLVEEVLAIEVRSKETIRLLAQQLMDSKYHLDLSRVTELEMFFHELSESIIEAQKWRSSLIGKLHYDHPLIYRLEAYANSRLEWSLHIAQLFIPHFRMDRIKRHFNLFEDTKEESFALELVEKAFAGFGFRRIRQNLIVLLDQSLSEGGIYRKHLSPVETLIQIDQAKDRLSDDKLHSIAMQTMNELYPVQRS